MSAARTAIGARRLRATLEEPVDTPDGMGGVNRVFVPRVTLWARLEALSGDERDEAGRAEAASQFRLTIRWRGDVTAAMRFAAGPRVFNLLASHDPDGRRRELVCRVEEVRP